MLLGVGLIDGLGWMVYAMYAIVWALGDQELACMGAILLVIRSTIESHS